MTTQLNPNQVNNDVLNNSVFRQAIVNGLYQVAQLAAPNLSTAKQWAAVDMFYAKGAGTAVSAGTIAQTTTANVGNSGFALKLAGVTLTGTGIVTAYHAIESAIAKVYKNKTASFGVRVYHDVGSAKNYTIKINKANSADNFSAVTNISTGSAVSVANTTETLIKLENVSLGDCSNGIEIEVYCESGAITTKNFEFGEWQFNEGAVLLPFMPKSFDEELKTTMRHYEKSFAYATAPAQNAGIIAGFHAKTQVVAASAADYALAVVPYRIPKRIAVTPTIYNIAAANAQVRNITTNSDCSSTSADYSSEFGFRVIATMVSGSAVGNLLGFQWTADARVTLV